MKKVGILLMIFENARHLSSANGIHIAGYISEIGTKICSELPGDSPPEGPRNIPSDIGSILGFNLATKTSEHFSEQLCKLPSIFPIDLVH